MKPVNMFKPLFFSVLLIFSINSFAQVIRLNWDKTRGVPFHQSFDLSTGFDAFIFPDDSHIAFLLKQDKLIRVFNLSTGEKTNDIPVSTYARSFCFFNNSYYLLSEKYIEIITPENKDKKMIRLPGSSDFFEKIISDENHIYIYTSAQKTWGFDPFTEKIEFVSGNGLQFTSGKNFRTKRLDDHHFLVQGTSLQQTIKTEKKLGSACISGFDGNNLYIDMQFILQEVPLKVAREIWKIKVFQNSFGEPEIEQVPDCYFIHVPHDISVWKGSVYYTLTTPENISVYRLFENNKIKIDNRFSGYHYNLSALTAPVESPLQPNTSRAAITRAEIIANAEPFDTHQWYCNPGNIKDYSCGGKQVVTPSWVTVGYNISLPYMWGGWSSLSQFDQGLLNLVSAGDCNTTGGGAGASCAVGVDCSGFISRAWNLSNKYGTSTLPNISTAYASFTQLLPGDIVNYAGHHVRLVHTVNTNGTWLMIESSASATNWSVGYATYTVAQLQGSYIPRYYNDVVNVIPDTTAPQTSVITSSWHTDDFSVTFQDTDNTGIMERYWLAAGFNGQYWTAGSQHGFFYDDFTDSVNTAWSFLENSWGIQNGMLSQSNEAITQNNAYSSLHQDSTTKFLYQWKMKLTGSGSDRRAGIYIFSDSATALQRNNAYMVYYRADLDLCQIYKSVNNSITLMTEDPCVIDETNWFDCMVTYDPVTGLITAYLNGEPATTWTDSVPLKNGSYVSLRTGACHAYFDEIKVYRGRGNSAFVSVGLSDMIPYDNPGPQTPSCLILSCLTDMAGNIGFSETATNIDFSPPPAVTFVSDNGAVDMDTAGLATQLSVFWNHSTDPNSGLIGYRYALGISPGNADIVTWTYCADTSAVCSGLSLVNNQTYYFSVKALNNAGIESAGTSSDGIFIGEPQGISPALSPEMTIARDPGNNNIRFTFGKTGNYTLTLFDVTGKKIAVHQATGNSIIIKTAALSSGVYFYEITEVESGNKSGKIGIF